MASPALSRASSMRLSPSASRTSSMKSSKLTGTKKSKKEKKVSEIPYVTASVSVPRCHWLIGPSAGRDVTQLQNQNKLGTEAGR